MIPASRLDTEKKHAFEQDPTGVPLPRFLDVTLRLLIRVNSRKVDNKRRLNSRKLHVSLKYQPHAKVRKCQGCVVHWRLHLVTPRCLHVLFLSYILCGQTGLGDSMRHIWRVNTSLYCRDWAYKKLLSQWSVH